MPDLVYPKIPHEMNRFARNRRLYDYLFDMGLYVDAVCIDGNPDKIDRLIVSTAPPKVNLVPENIRPPVQGTEIAQDAEPPLSLRDNVIEFPTVVRVPVSVLHE